MFDYWIRRGLVKVVRVGEKEEDDSLLFTATSTPDQWMEQGDYFKKKGLWDPAVKCYRKAGCDLLEKEAEAYCYAQRARQTRGSREQQQLFEKAAECFLLCDHNQHDVTFLTNAARCLKNAKKHSEAAKLFERLGEVHIYLDILLVLIILYHFLPCACPRNIAVHTVCTNMFHCNRIRFVYYL